MSVCLGPEIVHTRRVCSFKPWLLLRDFFQSCQIMCSIKTFSEKELTRMMGLKPKFLELLAHESGGAVITLKLLLSGIQPRQPLVKATSGNRGHIPNLNPVFVPFVIIVPTVAASSASTMATFGSYAPTIAAVAGPGGVGKLGYRVVVVVA